MYNKTLKSNTNSLFFCIKKIHIIIFILTLFSFTSCSNSSNLVEAAITEVENAEMIKNEMTSKDWENLAKIMEELEYDLELNRDRYSSEQIVEVEKIQGRYAALIVKKGINDFKESVKGLGNKLEGFIEGLTDTTYN